MKNKLFYADVNFNRSKRQRFFLFLILAVVFIGGTGGSLVYMGGATKFMGYFFLALTVGCFFLIPSTLKNYPTNNNPILSIEKNKVNVMGTVLTISKIHNVKVNIAIPSPLKKESEYLELLDEYAKNKPTSEELYRGTVDFYYADISGKDAVIYTTLEDSIGALQQLVNCGLKRYTLTYSIKKHVKNAEFKITKEENNDKE